MVIVARRGREEEVARVFRKWGLAVTTIGELTGDRRAEIRRHGRTEVSIPIAPLTDDAPVYQRPVAEPAWLAALREPPAVPPAEDPTGALERLLATPELGSKEWIHRQYDSTVRTNTVQGPGGDAAVLLLKGTPNGLALVSDVNPVYCFLDPREGGRQAVAEAVRNLAMVGAEPVGLTDCLNFGNPENPEILWQFREAVRGISEACRALDVPVISGNVSLYNETDGRSIHPTPTVAMVGLIEDLGDAPESAFRHTGDRVVLLGRDAGELGGSAYLRLLHGVERGRPPRVDLDAERRLAELMRAAVRKALVRTAHDVSDGGVAITLAEATFARGVGARVRIDATPTALFSESQARAVVALAAAHLDELLALAERHGVPAAEIGETGGDRLVIDADGARIDAPVARLHDLWAAALPRALGL
jgi:phosphoribosylformylglycinamidine synthase